jgi:hypothetical protein
MSMHQQQTHIGLLHRGKGIIHVEAVTHHYGMYRQEISHEQGSKDYPGSAEGYPDADTFQHGRVQQGSIFDSDST